MRLSLLLLASLSLIDASRIAAPPASSLTLRRLRGGEAEAEAAAAAAAAGSKNEGSSEDGDDEAEVAAALAALSRSIDAFMDQFAQLESGVLSTARPSILGRKASPEAIAARPDRRAFKEAHQHFCEVHRLMRGESDEALPAAAGSMQLLRQAALYLSDDEAAAKENVRAVPAETVEKLAALRAAGRRKAGGTVASALSQLREALAGPLEAHSKLVAALGASQVQPVPAALSREAVTAKLNTVPTFCLLDGQSRVVGMREEEGATPTACFYTDPAEARAVLESAKRAMPDVRGLHLGVTPLGRAFAACGGWPGDEPQGHIASTLKLQGSAAVREQMGPFLREQAEKQGLPEAAWQLPVFCTDQLQSAHAMPFFLSREALVDAWVVAGLERDAVPDSLTAMDLRVLVQQMSTTDKFAWNTVNLLASREAVDLVSEAYAEGRAVAAARSGGGAAESAAAALDAAEAGGAEEEEEEEEA